MWRGIGLPCECGEGDVDDAEDVTACFGVENNEIVEMRGCGDANRCVVL